MARWNSVICFLYGSHFRVGGRAAVLIFLIEVRAGALVQIKAQAAAFRIVQVPLLPGIVFDPELLPVQGKIKGCHQAGREVRIMVKPEEVTEDSMILLARDIAKKIEAELEYPGQIKVNVIRETKAVEFAK